MAANLDLAAVGDLTRSTQAEAASLSDLLAATEPGQSVHGLRRRIKQLRSLLRLLRASLGEASYRETNAALRMAADALAGHRRAEALVATAAKHLGGAGHGAGFWCGVAEAYRAAHAEAGDPVQALATARSAAARAAALLGSAALAEPPGDAVAEAFLAGYGKARKLLRKGLDSGAPETLHEARKFVIHHLHHMKLLQPARQRRLAELEALRESLGDLNDLDELQQLAAGLPITEADARRMRRARKGLLRRAAGPAQKLFRASPAALGKRMRHAAEPRSPRSGVALEAGE